MGKHGEYELRKDLRNLFRIIPEQEEEQPQAPKGKKELKGEEIIED